MKNQKVKNLIMISLIIIGTSLFVVNIDIYLLLNEHHINVGLGTEPKVMVTAIILIFIWWIVSSITWIKQMVKMENEKKEDKIEID